jgi:hypothetical protein
MRRICENIFVGERTRDRIRFLFSGSESDAEDMTSSLLADRGRESRTMDVESRNEKEKNVG